MSLHAIYSVRCDKCRTLCDQSAGTPVVARAEARDLGWKVDGLTRATCAKCQEPSAPEGGPKA